MPFLVYEQDPFIRADIRDTLTEAFPDARCAVVATEAEAASAARDLQGPLIAILSTVDGMLDDLMEKVSASNSETAFMLISDGPIATTNGAFLIQRPFSSGTLIASVRGALDALGRGGD